MAVEHQVASIWAASNGYIDDIPVSSVGKFEKEFLAFLDRSYKKLLASLAKEKAITAEIEAQLKTAVSDFKKGFSA